MLSDGQMFHSRDCPTDKQAVDEAAGIALAQLVSQSSVSEDHLIILDTKKKKLAEEALTRPGLEPATSNCTSGLPSELSSPVDGGSPK